MCKSHHPPDQYVNENVRSLRRYLTKKKIEDNRLIH